MRFDFSHGKAVTDKEIVAVEKIAQGMIAKELPIFTRLMPLKQAQKINGLRAVFGEAYPDPVRVVSVEVQSCTIKNVF